MNFSNKDLINLQEAYENIVKSRLIENSQPNEEEEANNLIAGFNMLPSSRKSQAFERLKGLIGKEVILTRAVGQKTSSGYGRDDGSATVPGSGGSVAHTEFELEDGEIAKGAIEDVKQSKGQKDYTLNGNLILTVAGKDYNMNQGTRIKVQFTNRESKPGLPKRW